MLQGPNTQLATLASQIHAGHGTVPGEDAPAAQDATTAAQGASAPGGQRSPYYGDMTPYANASKSVESGGNYSAIGPNVKGDKAYGAYQVMGKNIPSWTKDVLGVSMTPEQFVASPEAQDMVFNAKFRQYLNKYGTPQDAASAWFTGGPLSTGAGKSDGGSTTEQYVGNFMSALTGGAPQGAAQPQQQQPSGAMAPAPQGQPGMVAPQPLPASDTPTPAPQQVIPQPAADTRQDRFGQVGAGTVPQPAQTVVPQQQVQQPPQALIGAPGGEPLNWHALVGDTGNTLLDVMRSVNEALAKNPELADQLAQRLIKLGIDPSLMNRGQ